MNSTQAFANLGTTLIVSLILYVLFVIATWKIFTKAGEKGWKSIIPVYNTYILFKIAWKKSMFWVTLGISVILCILSIVTSALTVSSGASTASLGIGIIIISILEITLAIVSLVISIKLYHRLSKAFGHGAGFTVGLLFLNFIFMLILGFGSSQYIGNTTEIKE